MATPALRLIRRALPGAYIAGLVRPSLHGLLDGLPFLDEILAEQPAGMMGHKRIAARLRQLRFDAALLLTNSFSTALTARLAGIPRRFGYDRDARGMLLTDRLAPPLRRDTLPFSRSRTAPNEWAPVPACDYYSSLARRFLTTQGIDPGPADRAGPLELHISDEARAAADRLLQGLFKPHRARSNTEKNSPIGSGAAAHIPDSPPSSVPSVFSVVSPIVLLNPGGNNPAKRWPAERFAQLAAHLIEHRRAHVLISGSPAEADLTAQIHSLIPGPQRASAADLPSLLNSQASSLKPLALLKAIIARCNLMITNDTGPRHIAAALGVPVVTLFGPTDHRWTTIPFDRERILLADPTLPEEEVANDHPERCAIDRIQLATVIAAADSLLTA